jgi:hypothetical protein
MPLQASPGGSGQHDAIPLKKAEGIYSIQRTLTEGKASAQFTSLFR